MKTFGVDNDGIIVTEVSIEKITPTFKPIVDRILNLIVKEFQRQLDGVYLYESIVTGKAIIGESDFDSILVFKEKPDAEGAETIRKLEANLSRACDRKLRGVGLEFTNVADVCGEKEQFGGMCFMKHLCVCVYGNDLTKNTPGFKPSAKVARGFNGDIKQSLDQLHSKIVQTQAVAEINKMSQSAAKKIIRTGFSLVMPRSKSWTTDLQLSCETFSKFYPEKAENMRIALAWAKSGSTNKKAVLEYINTFGKWLAEEFQREIPVI